MRRLETLAASATTLHAYLQLIGEFPRLGLEQERELGWRIRRDRDPGALHTLVESNLRFVVAYAKRYRAPGVALLDLIHEGNLGLIAAARCFDPERHRSFIHHAAWWIRESILQRLDDSEAAALQAAFARASVAADLPLDTDDRDRERAMEAGPSVSPLDAPPGAEAEEAGCDETRPTIFDIGDEVARDAIVRDLATAVDCLDPRERAVVRWRHGLHDAEPRSVQQVSELTGIRPGQVRAIEAQAVDKLRRRLHLLSCLN